MIFVVRKIFFACFYINLSPQAFVGSDLPSPVVDALNTHYICLRELHRLRLGPTMMACDILIDRDYK